MLTINSVFILSKNVNYCVNLFSYQNMNSPIALCSEVLLNKCQILALGFLLIIINNVDKR